MTKENENKNANWSSREVNSYGDIMIADDVIATIAAMAATEVEGVASLQGNFTNELIGKLGIKNQTKGIKVDLSAENVAIEVSVAMKANYNILVTCKKIQDHVKGALESFLGLNVGDVNVNIVGVDTN